MLFLFSSVFVLFLVKSSSLLLSLIILELLSFMALGCFVIGLVSFSGSDYIILALFSVFVLEGVIGVSGLIGLVSFSGSDYLVVSSFSKC